MSEEIAITYCANHPTVEASLHCNRCEKPICVKCAVLTPTGYRCKECVRGQQKAFETAEWYDYPIAFIISALLAYIGSLIVPRLGFFTLFIAPVAGVVIAELIRAAIRKRRSKRLFQLVVVGIILGSLPTLLLVLTGMASYSSFGLLLPLIWQGFYSFTVASTAYYRLGGIQIR
jgi:hypothetical protein